MLSPVWVSEFNCHQCSLCSICQKLFVVFTSALLCQVCSVNSPHTLVCYSNRVGGAQKKRGSLNYCPVALNQFKCKCLISRAAKFAPSSSVDLEETIELSVQLCLRMYVSLP